MAGAPRIDPEMAALLEGTNAGQRLMAQQEQQSPSKYYEWITEFAPLADAVWPSADEVRDNPELAAASRFSRDDPRVANLRMQGDVAFSRVTGKLIYRDTGVMVDPATGEVEYPPDAEVPGSPLWLRQTASWSKAEATKWRTKLVKFGYEIAEEGPVDQLLQASLADFFAARYINGKDIPLEVRKMEDIDRAFDPAPLRNNARALYQTLFSDNPTDDELQKMEQFVKREAVEMLKKGKTEDPNQAIALSQERYIDKVQSSPEAELFGEMEEQEEMSTKLRDSLISTARLIG